MLNTPQCSRCPVLGERFGFCAAPLHGLFVAVNKTYRVLLAVPVEELFAIDHGILVRHLWVYASARKIFTDQLFVGCLGNRYCPNLRGRFYVVRVFCFASQAAVMAIVQCRITIHCEPHCFLAFFLSSAAARWADNSGVLGVLD